MSSKTLHLVCNSHLDPVWLWEWEEGVAEALATFRTAADLCQEFGGFVFNHNEALLYRWVEEHDPELFARIRGLVRRQQWHIMGGWFLQPDCNLPSGESFVRQMVTGISYFQDRFGSRPRTAVNLDSFGHSRGLVQILRKAGFTSYLFCRPDSKVLDLPAADFVWVGYDGSEIMAHRASDHYNSEMGKARQKVEKWLEKNGSAPAGLLLWGVGDHGGGPSRQDLSQLRELSAQVADWEIRHSVPEAYFDGLQNREGNLARRAADLNPWAVGCYTSMALVKQKHRRLENAYFLTEKMVTAAALQGLVLYPSVSMQEALRDLLFCQFHDILGGSAIPQVEAHALQRLDHGLEILARIRLKTFFALLSGQPKPAEDEFPIFAFNPHPYPLEEIMVGELQPLEPVHDRQHVRVPRLSDNSGNEIPCQLEKESSNVADDWRKRVVFQSRLEPGQMSRFMCRLEMAPVAVPTVRAKQRQWTFCSDIAEVTVNTETGLLDGYRVNGLNYLLPGALRLLVREDDADPWGMRVRSFNKPAGHFTLMSQAASARFAGVAAPGLEAVRVIEAGPVRTIVEALFCHGDSAICLHYKIPRQGSEIEIEARVYWLEKDRLLKLELPAAFSVAACRGQVAYGVEEFNRAAEELAAQKWVALVSSDRRQALTVINDGCHGFDFDAQGLRLSLLRSPAYAGHPVANDIPIVAQDRFTPRLDQGERLFRFWINGGAADERLALIDRESLVKNEFPMVLSCSPPGRDQGTAGHLPER